MEIYLVTSLQTESGGRVNDRESFKKYTLLNYIFVVKKQARTSSSSHVLYHHITRVTVKSIRAMLVLCIHEKGHIQQL